jgi:hypothetical protein
MVELQCIDCKRIHHHKYFTWIEQQGKSIEELNRYWHDYENYWLSIKRLTSKIDVLVSQFNKKVNL